MYRIQTMNKISPVGLNRFPSELYEVGDAVQDPQGILVRSAKLLDLEFNPGLLAIARAGVGVNNIPLDRCAAAGIPVFSTPGANANAVKELVICAMLMGSRDIPGAIRWVREQAASGVDVSTVVEKGKSAFIGPELYKKTLGIIGLGAIGSIVANTAISLGMDVYGYDPFLSVDTALRLDRHVHVVKDINDLYKRSDYITMHIHYTEKTAHMIDADAIAAMKRGVRVINLARGEIVDDEAMLTALDTVRVLLDVLEDMNLDAEQMDKIYDTLENLGIDTVGEDYIPELPDDAEPPLEAMEEIPGEEAFPAYLESVIAAFYERAGKVRLRNGKIASVTIGGTVSPAGGNFEEPVTQATLKVVGAFHGLSRERSDARKYPSIHPIDSWSKYQGVVDMARVEKARGILRRSSEINQMMKVIGEEGTSAEDYILYQKGELLDAVYLQQNSFDPIDAACEPERQAHEFNVLYDVLTRDYALSDKKEIRAFFNQVRQEFLDWHGTVYGTPEFAAQETKLTDLYRSKVTG